MNSVRSLVVFQLMFALLALVLLGKGLVHTLATTMAKPISELSSGETIADVVIWMDGVFALADLQPFEEMGEDSESQNEEISDWEDTLFVFAVHFGFDCELDQLDRVSRASDRCSFLGVASVCTPPPEQT
ncbi:MAG: hypothetical protein GC193_10990 [Cryomorphaceae bacterium]|nr:hypothetical protein [Cryomorphaceae bacterium]